MDHAFISTSMGKIAVYQKKVKGTIPVIFLHGVYYDHNLWQYQINRITDRAVIALDMPLHGRSKDIIKTDWNLEDCGIMLQEVLDALAIAKVFAIGHSWGSMTVLRAAAKAPEKFQAIGFCNMPFKPATSKTRQQFRLQHMLLPFRNFYIKQVARFVYDNEMLNKNPDLLKHLHTSMHKLSAKEVKQTDKSVIIHADDGEPFIRSLKVPAIALKGKADYVAMSDHLQTTIVEGGHVSPLEAPEKVFIFLNDVFNLNFES